MDGASFHWDRKDLIRNRFGGKKKAVLDELSVECCGTHRWSLIGNHTCMILDYMAKEQAGGTDLGSSMSENNLDTLYR